MKLQEVGRKYSRLVKLDLKTVDFQKLYKKWNKLLFNGELPDIPIELKTMKGQTGLAKCIIDRATNKPKDIKIYITDNLKLTRKDVNGVLIHEMIHVYFFMKEDYKESHGIFFRAKARELSKIAKIDIPLTHDIGDHEVDEDIIPPKEFVVIEAEGLIGVNYKKGMAVALYSKPVFMKNHKDIATSLFDLKKRNSGRNYKAYMVKSNLYTKYPMQRIKKFRSTGMVKLDYYLASPHDIEQLRNAKVKNLKLYS